MTFDRWETERDYEAFMAERGRDYEALDEQLADLTVSEIWSAEGFDFPQIS